MARLLADEDVYAALIHGIRDRGHDVTAVVDYPNRGAADHYWMLSAATERRIILTHNWRHFLMLHRAWIDWPVAWNTNPVPEHEGIIAVPQKDMVTAVQVVVAIQELLDEHAPLTNRYFRMVPSRGWISG